MNMMKTVLLMTGLTLLLVLAGSALGGKSGMMTAFIFACIMNIGTYWFSDKIVLAMYGAKEVSYAEAPEIHSIEKPATPCVPIVSETTRASCLGTPNAFAT